jgi:hypothetical protein
VRRVFDKEGDRGRLLAMFAEAAARAKDVG